MIRCGTGVPPDELHPADAAEIRRFRAYLADVADRVRAGASRDEARAAAYPAHYPATTTTSDAIPPARLTADEEALLRALAGGPMSLRDLLHAVTGPDPATSPTTSATGLAEWTRHCRRLRTADGRLVELGLVAGPPGARRLTPAGREEIAGATADRRETPE